MLYKLQISCVPQVTYKIFIKKYRRLHLICKVVIFIAVLFLAAVRRRV